MSERRKGAQRRDEVTAEIRQALNQGELETASLAEMLVVDFAALLSAAAPEVTRDLPRERWADLAPEAGLGVVRRMELAGRLLAEVYGSETGPRFAAHRSDLVRGWAAYAIPHLTPKLDGLLAQMRPLADDANFGVREWAWMATRPVLATQLPEAIAHLQPWTGEPSANLRRFASEVLRPRGVWCAHLPLLKERPALALPVLEPLRSDSAKYVRDSVANWLNDAGKSQPDWVREVCTRWSAESSTKETASLVKRAMRSFR